jgi:subtilisin family serine protease
MNMRTIISILLIVVSSTVWAQRGHKSADKFTDKHVDWHHKDYKQDKLVGISTYKLYNEEIKDQKAKKKIVVAIIDSGVDIEHEDLKDQIWTNVDEIVGNGIDDDKNGYVDDIHGWNFIGNKEGKHLNKTTLETTRYYKILKDKKEKEGTLSPLLKKDFSKVERDYLYHFNKNSEEFKQLNQFLSNYLYTDSVAKAYLKVDSLTYQDVEGAVCYDPNIQSSIDYQKSLLKRGFERASFMGYYDYVKEQVEVLYNLDFNPRADIIGDDLSDINNTDYGNNDVKGPSSDHGTMVAGLVAATRNNNMGIDGIANHVEIMVLRTVPDGDEYDKDVALSIRYAVDNGANVINMSFGKSYSPEISMVWEAMQYAASKNVLMVKAAGNENLDIDVDIHYPTAFTNGKKIDNVLTVGASDKKKNKWLKADFSNYGQKGVDVFAPGVRLLSTAPESYYDKASGTSFSSPVVAGVAALIWSYFPELTAKELREVLLESAVDMSKRKVVIPAEGNEKKKKVRFATLSTTGKVINAYAAFQLAKSKTTNSTQQ